MQRWGALSIGCVTAAAMCLIALARLPIGYYTLLRICVCLAAGVAGAALLDTKIAKWSIPAIFVALLYNPFEPIGFSRDAWAAINITTAPILVAYAFVHRIRVADTAPPTQSHKEQADAGESGSQAPAEEDDADVFGGDPELDELDDFDDDDDDDDEEAPQPPPRTAAQQAQLDQLIRDAEDRLRRRFASGEIERDQPRHDLERAVSELQAKIDAIPHPLENPNP
jgi:hypothetical protein